MKNKLLVISVLLGVLLFAGCNLFTEASTDLTPSTIVFADGTTVSKQIGSGNYTNTVTGDGTGSITYTSGTPATATVDPSTGEITLLAVGTTVITAVKVASGTYEAVTNTYTLTVTAIPVNFTSVEQVGGASGVTDSTSLTLTFDVDPDTLDASDITITGATKGDLSGTGTTRTLAISDITANDGGTVTVSVSNPTNYTISNSTKTAKVYILVPSVGTAFRGGKVAYILVDGDTGYVDGETHGLIAALTDQSTVIVWISGGVNQSTQKTYVNGSDDTGTSTAIGTGQANTKAIIAQAVAAGNNDLTTYAAGICDAYTNDGFSDWFLPSKDELNKLYLNKVAIAGFNSSWYYWSSSESGSGQAWGQNFDLGYQHGSGKDDNDGYVRPVRAF